MRKLVCMAVLALVLAGCGGSEALTNEQVEAMSDQDQGAMLNCQLTKAIDDLGEDEAMEVYADKWADTAQEDGDMLHVILDRDGYKCREFVS